MRTSLFIILFTVTVFGCSKKAEPPPPMPPPSAFKENAVELLLFTKRLPDGRTVLALHKNIFVHHAELDSTVYRDTLPDLGDDNVKIDETDENGDVSGQKATTVHRPYDILFKVDTLKQ